MLESRFCFLGSKIITDSDCSHELKRRLLLERKAVTNLDNIFKGRDITLLTKVLIVKAMFFPVVMYVRMWELGHKEGWELKNWCFQIVVLEKTVESPFDCKEIKLVNPKGNQSWIFIGRTDAEGEAPVLWSPDAKSQLIGKDPDTGKDWRQEEKGMTDGWMASPTQWTWVWASSRRWRRTGKPGVLQSMGSQRVRHNWVTEQQSRLI